MRDFARRVSSVRVWLLLAMICFSVLAALCGAERARAQSAPAAQAAQPAQAQTPAAEQKQAYALPPEKLAKAVRLSRIRNLLEITGGVWDIVFLWLLLRFRAWSVLEAWAVRLTEKRWVQGLVFFAAFLVITSVAGLPFGIAGHYESRSYGISVQSWGGWWWDAAKGLAVSLVVGSPVLLLFHWIVKRWPRRYWLGIWVATLPLTLIAIFASPLVIDPLFNKFEPLTAHHAPLVDKLETVVSRTGIDIPPSRMFLMKASEKYNGINAYVTGIGASKRYVMWDTATDRLADDEVLFIFGHESGHYVLGHIPKMLAINMAGTFFLFWACAWGASWMVRRFGPRWGMEGLEARAGFVVLLFVISIASFVLQPLSNGVSRYFEHQADVYGQEAIHGIVADPQKTAVAAFNHLGEAWLEDPNPSPLIEIWLYNHPSVQSRARFAEGYDPWANGGSGEFFAK
jgi:Zn-dependent protease with chaperone function